MGTKLGTKMEPNWTQIDTKLGSKMAPKWDQKGTKMGPPWDPAPVRHRDPKKCQMCRTVNKNTLLDFRPAPCATRIWDPLGDSLKYPTRTL